MSLGYRAWGHGDHAVFLLHGWLGNETTYDNVLPVLPMDACTFLAPAYRGYGASLERPGRYTVDEVARDVLALADSLNIDRFSLVGHSMGGKVALRVLADAPHRVRRLAAVTPVPASCPGFDEATWALFRSAPHDVAARAAIIDASTGNRLAAAWVRATAERSVSSSRPEAVAGYLESWAGGDFSDELPTVDLPARVYLGAHDPTITPEAMRGTYLAALPGAGLELLENAGHYPMDETPIAFGTTLGRFLTGHSEVAS